MSFVRPVGEFLFTHRVINSSRFGKNVKVVDSAGNVSKQLSRRTVSPLGAAAYTLVGLGAIGAVVEGNVQSNVRTGTSGVVGLTAKALTGVKGAGVGAQEGLAEAEVDPCADIPLIGRICNAAEELKGTAGESATDSSSPVTSTTIFEGGTSTTAVVNEVIPVPATFDIRSTKFGTLAIFNCSDEILDPVTYDGTLAGQVAAIDQVFTNPQGLEITPGLPVDTYAAQLAAENKLDEFRLGFSGSEISGLKTCEVVSVLPL